MPRKVEELELQETDLGQTAVAVTEIDRSADCGEDERHRIRSGRLAGLTMWQAIFVLSWPVLVESFLNACVGLVDTMLAAGISEGATDAIGVASYFNWFVSLIAVALGVGATAMVSRSMGRGRIAVANAAVGQVFMLSLVLGTVVAVLIAVAAPFIAGLLQLEGDGLQHAVTYLRIAAIGIPGLTVLFSGINCCRGAGDSVRPMVTMIIINIINIAISFSLSGVDLAMTSLNAAGEAERRVLFENPVGLDYGVSGIAVGTCVAWLIGGCIMTMLLARGVHGLKLKRRRLRPHWLTIRRLVRVAAPNFVETFGMWFGNFVVLMLVGQLASSGLIGAHVVAVRIEAFSFLPGFAMATAAATLAGQYLGAGSATLARRAVIRCAIVATSIMFLFGIAFLTIPEAIVGVFSQQPLHLEQTPQLLFICGFIQIPFALVIVMRGAMRGAGDTRVVMMLTWLSTYVIRLPMAWLFSGVEVALPGGLVIPNPEPMQHWFDLNPLAGLWMGMCAELAIRFLIFFARFLHGGWTRQRV